MGFAHTISVIAASVRGEVFCVTGMEHSPTGEGVWRRRRANYRALQGGVGNLGLPAATSSGQRITCLPSCHCVVTAFWAIWNPRSSIAKSPRIVFVFSLSNVSRSLSEAVLPARRAASANSWQPA